PQHALSSSAYWQPATESHESLVHGLPSSQSRRGPPVHDPPEQASPVVQAFPSSHGFALLVCPQPLSELQESFVHALPSLQLIAVPPHAPFEQTSLVVQALLSLHDAV